MFKNLIAVSFFLTLTGVCAAQHNRPENEVIRKFKIKERRTHCFLYNSSEVDSANYIVSFSKYNSLGFPVLQIRYKENGDVSDKFAYEYQSDSLQKKMTCFGSKDTVTSIVTSDYGSNGYLISRSVNDIRTEKKHKVLFEWDFLNFTLKSYSSFNGRKLLTGINDFDSHWKCIKNRTFDQKGEVSNIYINEFDSSGNQIKSYKLKNEEKILLTECKYNSANRLTEEINIYNNALKLWDFNGMVESYKKGDRKVVNFSYDNNGLLLSQTEKVNDKLVAKIEYEYSY